MSGKPTNARVRMDEAPELDHYHFDEDEWPMVRFTVSFSLPQSTPLPPELGGTDVRNGEVPYVAVEDLLLLVAEHIKQERAKQEGKA